MTEISIQSKTSRQLIIYLKLNSIKEQITIGFNRNNGGEIKYKIGKVDEILEEKGNQFTALREESFDDGEKYYTAIRRFYTDNDGKENMGKGVTFLTPEGPAAAAVAIIKSGFGTTTEYLETLKTREDFDASLMKYWEKMTRGMTQISNHQLSMMLVISSTMTMKKNNRKVV